MIEKTIREAEADTFRTVMTNPKYFVNGKAVPVSYYDNAFKHSGLGGELLGYRQDLAEVVSTLESKRMTYDIYKQMLEVWRTQSANERGIS